MAERPILFSPEMVRAILDGRKSQTRRVVKPPKHWPKRLDFHSEHMAVHQDGGGNWIFWSHPSRYLAAFTKMAYPNGEGIECPYGKSGDQLWVRETFGIPDAPFEEKVKALVAYRADQGERLAELNRHFWRPSIFMPRWASRITLEIVNVRVERLQQITNDDARAEGVYACPHRGATCNYFETGFNQCFGCAYRLLWNQINGARGFGWDKNPWVWVIDFKRVKDESARVQVVAAMQTVGRDPEH